MTDDSSLIEFITSQRWYGSKTRDVASATVVDRAMLARPSSSFSSSRCASTPARTRRTSC